MNELLLKKYNVPVPRYTSYPPANFFGELTANDYLRAMHVSQTQKADRISFYLHIPYCQHLCHYCGCNSISMGKPQEVERYIRALHKEIDLLAAQLDKSRHISQIHYGGGSPSSIPLHFIAELNEHLLSVFPVIDEPEIAIECHPAYLDENAWYTLCRSGFTRFSIGVQDMDEGVLTTVNRRPSLLPLEHIVKLLHEEGKGVNLDFIYGLPHQSPESFAQTISKAADMAPDRLVTFSYAHVPWVNKAQLILEKAGLPSPAIKQQLFDTAKLILLKAGYQTVGMDHFVRPDDELYTALRQGTLHRNFQGYCTRRTTAEVFALGVTGISQLQTAYIQNDKNTKVYMETVESGLLPVKKGYLLNENEIIVREVVETLMCNNALRWNEVAQRLHRTVEEVKTTVCYNEAKLEEMASDGLLYFSPNEVRLTTEGLPFVRNVAALFDPLLHTAQKAFSKPV